MTKKEIQEIINDSEKVEKNFWEAIEKRDIEIGDALFPYVKNESLQDHYIRVVPHKFSPELEDYISKSARLSYAYAKYVLKDRFPPGEPAIIKDFRYITDYVKDVIKGPWIEAEPALIRERGGSGYIEYLNFLKEIGELENFYKRHPEAKEAPRGTSFTISELLNNPQKLDEMFEKFVKYYAKEEADLLLPYIKNPSLLIHYALVFNEKLDDRKEDIIATDPRTSRIYAEDVLKGPFPKGEDAIARDPEEAFYYAKDVLKGPFPKGEKAIARDPEMALNYAMEVLKEPWLKGERAIMRNYELLWNYYVPFLKEIGELKSFYERHLDNPEIAVDYLREFGEKITPEIEKSILQDPYTTYLYIDDILKKPWPKGEKTLAQSAEFSEWYAREILKAPFPLGEPSIISDAYYLDKYIKFLKSIGELKNFYLRHPEVKRNEHK